MDILWQENKQSVNIKTTLLRSQIRNTYEKSIELCTSSQSFIPTAHSTCMMIINTCQCFVIGKNAASIRIIRTEWRHWNTLESLVSKCDPTIHSLSLFSRGHPCNFKCCWHEISRKVLIKSLISFFMPLFHCWLEACVPELRNLQFDCEDRHCCRQKVVQKTSRSPNSM